MACEPVHHESFLVCTITLRVSSLASSVLCSLCSLFSSELRTRMWLTRGAQVGFAHNYCHAHSFCAHTHNTHRHLPDLFMRAPSLWSFTARSLLLHGGLVHSHSRCSHAQCSQPPCAFSLTHVRWCWTEPCACSLGHQTPQTLRMKMPQG